MVTVYWLENDNCLDGDQTYECSETFDNEDDAQKLEAFFDAEGTAHWRDDDED